MRHFTAIYYKQIKASQWVSAAKVAALVAEIKPTICVVLRTAGDRLLKLRMRKLKMNFWWDMEVLKTQVIFKNLVGKWTCMLSCLVLLLSIVLYVSLCNFCNEKGRNRLV